MNGRFRPWLTFITALMATLGIALGWGAVLYDRWYLPYHQLPAGQPGFLDGKELRLISLTQTRSVLTTSSYRPEKTPGAGSVFVVALIEVVLPTDGLNCAFSLVDTDGRTWRTSSQAGLNLPASTDCGDMSAGVRTRTRQVFEIPAASAPKLAGITPLFASRDQRFVLTPEG